MTAQTWQRTTSSMGGRESPILRFRHACQRDQAVVAAFVGGSVAAHTDDDVSDVDLYAVTLEPDYDQFFTRGQARASMGGLVALMLPRRD